MNNIDLRSDTVTQPTPAMRAVMAAAEVGDDVYGEDPSVNRLQELAASMLGKEAGLFVPSGTMGNLASILASCGRGDEVILGNKAHTFLYEGGGISALGGIHSHQIANQADGTLLLQDIEDAVRPDDPHDPVTRLVALENTHNRCGGVYLTAEYTRQVGDLAHQYGLVLHIDGARIFNAAIAQGVSAKELVEPADSLTFCLSKGLSAPVGSVICGSEIFIDKVLRVRKQLGGGMRQAGVLAAAGIVALETMVERLAEDHRRARDLATELKLNPGLVIDPGSPHTNMLFMNLSPEFLSTLPISQVSPAEWVAGQLAGLGVKVGAVGPQRFRLVTHCWIDDEDILSTAEAFRTVLLAV